MKNLLTNLQSQRKDIASKMNRLQESGNKDYNVLISRLSLLDESIKSVIDTYNNLIAKKRLNESAQRKVEKANAKMPPIEKIAKASRLNENWDVSVNDKTKTINVKYYDYAFEKKCHDDMTVNVKKYVQKLNTEMPNMVFESKNYGISPVGTPKRGNNDYAVEFTIVAKHN